METSHQQHHHTAETGFQYRMAFRKGSKIIRVGEPV